MYQYVFAIPANTPVPKLDECFEFSRFALLHTVGDEWSIFWPEKEKDVHLQLYPSTGSNRLISVRGTFTLELLCNGKALKDDEEENEPARDITVDASATSGSWLQGVALTRAFVCEHLKDSKNLAIKITLSDAVFTFRRDVFVERMREHMFAKNGDISVKLSTGKELLLHSQLLALQSPVFDATLKVEMKEKAQKEIDLSQYDEKAIGCLLDYIYTGSRSKVCELDQWKSAAELLQLAGMHELNGLSTATVPRILQLVDASTVLETTRLLCSLSKENEGGHLKRKLKENWDEYFPLLMNELRPQKKSRN